MNMRIICCAITAMACIALLPGLTQAQVVVVGAPTYAPPVIVQRPVVPALPVPGLSLAPTYSAGYAPAPVVASSYSTLSPVVGSTYVTPSYVAPSYVAQSYVAQSYVAPSYVAASPVVTSAPIVAPAPVVTYRPVYSSYSVPYTTSYVAPYVAARPAVVVPKVYLPGRPVRNALRAFTP